MKIYKVKDIIFGLRGEYKRIYKEVKKLKDYINDSPKGYDLYISKLNRDDAPAIMYSIKTGDKQPKSDLDCTIGGVLYQKGKLFEDKGLSFKDPNAFKEKANEILRDDFIDDMGMFTPDTTIKKKEGTIHNLIIWDNLIEYIRNNKRNLFRESIQYIACNDTINVETRALFKKVNDELVYNLLNEEVPEYALKANHKELIDKYVIGDLIISNNAILPNNKCQSYEVMGDNHILVLKR